MDKSELLLTDKDYKGKKQRSQGGTQGHGWQGTAVQRARIAEKTPQAVLKISSHSKSKMGVLNRMKYVSREGEIKLENEAGEIIDGVEEIQNYLEDWSSDFSKKLATRKAINMVLSLPKDTNKETSIKIARAFLKEQFSENNSYVFAGHDDTDHYHVHVIIKSQGHDGKQLRSEKEDLRIWRENFAEKARDMGVNVDASPRYARGVGEKTVAPVVMAIQSRGEVPKALKKGAQEALASYSNMASTEVPANSNDLTQGAALKKTKYEEKIEATNKRERIAFARVALKASELALTIQDSRTKEAALDMVVSLARYSQEMPVAKSRREEFIEQIQKKKGQETIPKIKPGEEEVRPILIKTVEGMIVVAKQIKDPVLRQKTLKATSAIVAMLDKDQSKKNELDNGREKDRNKDRNFER